MLVVDSRGVITHQATGPHVPGRGRTSLRLDADPSALLAAAHWRRAIPICIVKSTDPPANIRGLNLVEVTRILAAIKQGDPQAAEQLLPLVYDELRQVA